jgi:hypothetical protein
MTLQELLQELGPRLGLEDLAVGEDGTCTIGLGEDGEIHIGEDGAGACVVVANCGGLPDRGRAPYLRRLLEANFFHRDSGPGVLAVDPDLDESLLIRRLPLADLDVATFEQVLTEFAAYQERWLKRAESALIAGG